MKLKVENEFKVPEIPIKDLSYFIKIKEKNPKMKIGILNKDINGMTVYKKGDIVLFTPYTIDECYGKMLWEEIEYYISLCTIEIPSERYFEGESNTPTIGTMVSVPLKFIEYEIII